MASEVKVDTIKHSNGTTAITNDSSGNVTFGGTATGTIKSDAIQKADGTALITSGVAQSGLSVPASSGASWVFISKGTADDNVHFDFSLSSTYNYYMVLLQNVKPDTNVNHMYGYVTIDNFTNVRSGSGDYITTIWVSNWNGNSAGTGHDTINTSFFYASSLGQDAGDTGISGQLLFTNPSLAGQKKHLEFTYCKYQGNNDFVSGKGASCYCGSTDAVDGIRFQMANGNFASGSIALYGIKDA